MRGIVAYHQKIYTERQKSNGVSPHVCATRGPDLLMANEVTFLCFREGEWWRREGSCGGW